MDILWLVIPLTELLILGTIAGFITKTAKKNYFIILLSGIILFLVSTTVILTAYFRWFPIIHLYIGYSFILLSLFGAVFFRLKRITLGIFFSSFALLILLVSSVSLIYDDWQIDLLKNHCTKLVAELEQHKELHGLFPDTLNDIDTADTIKPLAVLLQGADESCGYHK